MAYEPHFLAEEDARREGEQVHGGNLESQAIADLQAALKQAQEERDRQKQFAAEQMDMATRLMFEAAGLRKQRDAAIERGVLVSQTMRALAEKYRGALEGFSLWLEQECKRGTLDLGFGPDWSAQKVQLALDRLLAPAEALSGQEGDDAKD